LASRTHSAIVEMRAVFHSVSTQGDDTLQVVQTLPNSGLLAFVRGPWPSTTHLHQDASSILRAQSSQFFGQFFYACAYCGHLQASVDPYSARGNRRSEYVTGTTPRHHPRGRLQPRKGPTDRQLQPK
jgi:hypothetical protein